MIIHNTTGHHARFSFAARIERPFQEETLTGVRFLLHTPRGPSWPHER